MGEFELDPADILPYLERKAVFQVYDNKIVDHSSCIGCDVDYHGAQCRRRCNCENGYCNDDIAGDGSCYCTLVSYGPLCRLCDGLFGSCPPSKGICNAGPTGDGQCKFCFDLDLNRTTNSSSFDSSSFDSDISLFDTSSFGIGLGSHYGPKCNDTCSCNPDNGICYTTGNDTDERAGKCIY